MENSILISSIIYTIAITIIVFGLEWIFLKRERKLADDNIEKFREFVRASKAKTLEDYEQALPTVGELPKSNQDEFIELDQMDPEQLLKAKKE